MQVGRTPSLARCTSGSCCIQHTASSICLSSDRDLRLVLELFSQMGIIVLNLGVS